VKATIDRRGNRTTLVWDANGQRTAVVNALGQRPSTVYDSAGRAIAHRRPVRTYRGRLTNRAGLETVAEWTHYRCCGT
jgi:YD repeat-containing protein